MQLNRFFFKILDRIKIFTILTAVISIFCSKEKNEQESLTIYLWRYNGWQENMGFRDFGYYNLYFKQLGLISTLLTPFFDFLSAHNNGGVDEAKIDKWYQKNMNNGNCSKISIRDEIDLLNEIYKEDCSLVSFSEKIFYFIQNDIKSSKSQDDSKIKALFFRQITLENVEKYLYIAKKITVANAVTNLYPFNHNDIDEIKIVLINNYNATNVPVSIIESAHTHPNTLKNRYLNTKTVFLIDLYFIVTSYKVFYSYLIRLYNIKNLNKKFSKEHKSMIKKYFTCFEAEYEKIIQKCITYNENIFVFFSTLYDDMNSIFKDNNKYFLSDDTDQNEIIFFHSTLEYLKAFDANCCEKLNVTKRLSTYIKYINTNFEESVLLLNDNNFKIFLKAYKDSNMKGFLNNNNEDIDEKFYIIFLNKKTIFLDEIMNQILLVFIKKQIILILKNQEKPNKIISNLIEKEKNRIIKNEFNKQAIVRNGAFKIIQEEEIKQFKINIKNNPNLYKRILEKLEVLQPESAIINNLIYFKLRTILFEVDVNKIEYFLRNELKILCQGVNSFFKYIDGEVLVTILSYACSKHYMIAIFISVAKNIIINETTYDWLDVTKFKLDIASLKQMLIELKNINIFEKMLMDVFKQHDLITRIIEYRKKLSSLIEILKLNDPIYNKSISNLINFLVNRLENSKEKMIKIKEVDEFIRLQKELDLVLDLNRLFVDCDKLISLTKSEAISKIQNNLESDKENYVAKVSIISESDLSTELNVFFEHALKNDNKLAIKILIDQIGKTTALYNKCMQKFTNLFELENQEILLNNIKKINAIDIKKTINKITMKDLLFEFESYNILRLLQNTEVEQKFVRLTGDIVSTSSFLIRTLIKDIIYEIIYFFELKIIDKNLISNLSSMINSRIKSKDVSIKPQNILINKAEYSVYLTVEEIDTISIEKEYKEILKKCVSLINKSISYTPFLKIKI